MGDPLGLGLRACFRYKEAIAKKMVKFSDISLPKKKHWKNVVWVASVILARPPPF